MSFKTPVGSLMRLIEVGTKLHSDGKKGEARQMFDYAYKMYSIFLGLRLKLIDISKFKKMSAQENPGRSRTLLISSLIAAMNKKYGKFN